MTELLLLLASVYLFSCIALYVMQDKLIFLPPQQEKGVYQSVSQNEITLSINNELLHGWKVNVDPAKNKTILYFGGNAEDVVYQNYEAKEFKIRQSISFNYPGYGKSSGKPTQQSLYKNSLDIYDFAVKEYQLKPQDIIVIGRSLGASVASYLAANRKIAGLILITPFDSIESIAAKHYKIFPVKYFLKNPFRTTEYIGQVKSPILMMAAENDEIVSEDSLQNLKQIAGENNRLIRYSGVGHNTIQRHSNYYIEMNNFIDSL